MEKCSKIFVAGRAGMVGSAIIRCLRKNGFQRLIVPSFAELDLTRQSRVEDFLSQSAGICVPSCGTSGWHLRKRYVSRGVYLL